MIRKRHEETKTAKETGMEKRRPKEDKRIDPMNEAVGTMHRDETDAAIKKQLATAAQDPVVYPEEGVAVVRSHALEACAQFL